MKYTEDRQTVAGSLMMIYGYIERSLAWLGVTRKLCLTGTGQASPAEPVVTECVSAICQTVTLAGSTNTNTSQHTTCSTTLLLTTNSYLTIEEKAFFPDW